MYRAALPRVSCFRVFFQGVIEDRIGFFPAAFAHQVRTGDQVFKCNRTFIGCKEQGQITLKEGQVLHKPDDDDGGYLERKCSIVSTLQRLLLSD